MVNQSGRIATYLITSSTDGTSSDTDTNDDTSSDTDEDEDDTTEDTEDEETDETLVQEDEYAEELASLINSYRSENGLNTLTVSSTLNSYAMIRAEEIYTLYSHTRPDGSTANSTWGTTGEILAKTSTLRTSSGAQAAFEAYQSSSEHNAIMLSKGFTQIGAGCVSFTSGSTTYYLWCVLFY